jgi:hypothetical protein
MKEVKLNSNGMKMSTQFEPHGEFLNSIDDRIVVTVLRGPWNAELISIWSRDVYQYALELQKQGTWGGIAIVSESMLCTPEAMDALRNAVRFGVEKLGCISQAIVASSDVAGRGLVEPAFRRVYEGLCVSNFFDDYSSAKIWTNQQIDLYAQKKQINEVNL